MKKSKAKGLTKREQEIAETAIMFVVSRTGEQFSYYRKELFDYCAKAARGGKK